MKQNVRVTTIQNNTNFSLLIEIVGQIFIFLSFNNHVSYKLANLVDNLEKN